MTKTKALKAAMLACGFALVGAAQAGGPSSTMLAYTCVGCHGPNGNSVGPASPSIAGISSAYFVETMQAYKSEERPSTIMSRIAKGYSDDDFKAMGEYFSKQKFAKAPQAYEKGGVDNGAKLHDKYCEKCHAEGGTSAEDDAGILAGQWRPYLEYTMADFMSGKREMPKKMKKKVEQMHEKEGDAGIARLLDYYGSQK